MKPYQLLRKRASRKCRGGYVLVMCLLVVAISSAIVLSMFHILRLQTAEATARRQMTVSNALADAAAEHAIAILIDQPNYRGTVGPISVPPYTDRTYVAQIADAGGDMQVTVLSTAGSVSSSRTLRITTDELDDRRATLGL